MKEKKTTTKNIGRTLSDINHSKILRSTSESNKNKNKNKQIEDLIKLKSFCIAKETIKKNKKKTPRMGENICI